MKRAIALLATLSLCSPLALASSCEASLPNDVTKVGETRLSVWFWDIYDARLYTENGNYQWQQREQIRESLLLDYLRDIKAKDLIETTNEEWQKLGLDHENQQQWLDRLASIWPNIKEGDCLLLREGPQGYATFYQGDKALGTIEDAAFTEQFLAIWLSPESRFSEERRELVGEAK